MSASPATVAGAMAAAATPARSRLGGYAQLRDHETTRERLKFVAAPTNRDRFRLLNAQARKSVVEELEPIGHRHRQNTLL